MINWKSEEEHLLWIRGKPRYLPKESVGRKPNLVHTLCLVTSGTLGEKKIRDLALLTFWPDIEQKTSRTLAIASQFLEFALANKSRSSAKKTWENPRPSQEALIISQSLASHFDSMSAPKNSVHKRNRFGDSGSPWRSPLDARKRSSLPPLTNTEVEVEAIQLRIYYIN